MNELRELYQEVIIDHNRNPRNCCELPNANHKVDGFNPLCGDKLTLYVDIQQGNIDNICFKGSGCAISMASASLMTEAIKGKSVAYAENLFTDFQQAVTTPITEPLPENSEKLGKLQVLLGVREYPSRVKCATLAWHTLHNALINKIDPASTE